ncbi:hypothetical protein, partial [Treponema pallidum]|uniref:hypothetical protein n=1 Tax=Treponema pallidum TaxID=160 RepID=UPI00244EEC40
KKNIVTHTVAGCPVNFCDRVGAAGKEGAQCQGGDVCELVRHRLTMQADVLESGGVCGRI